MEEKHLSEMELVRLCLQGNRLAEHRLYQQYVQAMYHTALRMLGQDSEALDVLQDAFLKVFQSLGSFRQESTLGAWIKRIVVNMSINHLRQKKQQVWQDLPPDLEQRPALTAEGIDALQAADIHKAILALPSGSRTVFNLFAVEGYSHQEIADLLGISESTSKSQYFRAKQLLQTHLKTLNYV